MTPSGVNVDNMRLYIAALRSGKYQQTKGALHRVFDDVRVGKDAFCCLGVACEVAIANGVEVVRQDLVAAVAYDGEAQLLPVKVAEWLGVAKSPVLSTCYCYSRSELAVHWNDIHKASFDHIADLFEQMYLPADWEETCKQRNPKI